MSIVRYHRHGPRHHIAFQNDMRRVFDRYLHTADADDSNMATAQWKPRVDIKEEAGRFVIFADLPGIDPQDIEVSMDQGVLSIKGERKSGASEEAGGYSRMERHTGGFHRRFALPDSADPAAVTATGRHGVLEVSIPKKPDTTPRRVRVEVNAAGSATSQGDAPTVQ